jgi:hypothetical protein
VSGEASPEPARPLRTAPADGADEDAARSAALRTGGTVVSVTIEGTEPLVGTAACERQEPVPFVGWLELLHAISRLVGADEGRRAPRALGRE